MSRAINTSLATIQFQVNARQANAAMLALQEASDDLNRAIDSVNRNIANLGKDVPKDNPQLLNYQNQLAGLKKDLKDVEKAQRDFLKGAKAADQLWKAASEGNIESLSFRSIKAGINGLKKRQEGLSPGDAQDMKDWRIIKEVIDEADRVMKQAGADVQNVVQTIREGGKVSEQAMRQTISTLKELKGSVDETDAEYRTYGNDLDFMEAKLQEFNEAQRRAKGEIVDANDARREMNKLTEEGAAATQREAEEADRLVQQYKAEGEELVKKRNEIKANIEDTQKQIDENHKLIEEKHRQLAADEETFNAEQQSRRTTIDGLKTQAEAERKLANEKSDAAETHRRAAELQKQTTEQLTEKVTELQGKLAELNAEPVKPKVDSSALDALKTELNEIESQLTSMGDRHTAEMTAFNQRLWKKQDRMKEIGAQQYLPHTTDPNADYYNFGNKAKKIIKSFAAGGDDRRYDLMQSLAERGGYLEKLKELESEKRAIVKQRTEYVRAMDETGKKDWEEAIRQLDELEGLYSTVINILKDYKQEFDKIKPVDDAHYEKYEALIEKRATILEKIASVEQQGVQSTDKLTEAQSLYNQKVQERIQKEQELETIKNRSWQDDPEVKRLDAEIAKLEELIAVTDKYKKQFTKMSDKKFEEGYIGEDAEVKDAYHIKLDPKKSIWGAADYLRGAYNDILGASLVDYAKEQDPSDQYGYTARYQKSAERVAKGVVENAQENLRRAILREIEDGNFTPEHMEEQIETFRSKMYQAAREAGEGNLKNDSEYNAYKYIVAQMEKYLEVAKKVQEERAKIAGGGEFLELAKHKDDIDAPREGLLWQKEKRDWDRATIKTEDIDRRRKDEEYTKSQEVAQAKNDETEAERQLNEEKAKGTQVMGEYAKATKEAVDVMLQAKKAEKELIQAEADRKDYVELQERRNELLKQYGITVADVTDETKLQAAAEKVVKQEEEARLEIAEKELAIRKEVYADAKKDKDLMGKKTKRDDDFAQELADYFGYDLSEKGSLADINQALNDVAQGDSEEKADFKEEMGMTVAQAIKNLNSHIHDIVKERIEKGMDISEFAEMENKEGDTHPISELIQPYVEQIDAAMDEYVNDKIDQLEQFDNLLDAKGESREVKIAAAKKDLVGLGTTGDGQSFADRIKGLDDLITKYKEEIATGEALMKSKKELTEGDKELAEAETQLSEKVGALSSAQRSAQAFDMRFNVPKGYTKPTTFTDEDNAADIFTKMQAAGRPFSKEAHAARNSLRDYLQNIIDTAPDAQQKLEHLKEVFVKLSDGQEPMWVKDVDMALKKINIPELQQQAEDAYNKVIDLRQKSTQVQEQSNEKSEEELRLKSELEEAQGKLAESKQRENDEQQQSVKLQGEAIEQGNKAAEAETKLADAQSEATQKQVEFNQKQQEGLNSINQMAQGNQALQESIDGLNGELEQNSKDIADNANKATEAEVKKAQARQLSIKTMEEMLAKLKEEYYTEELTAEKREEHKQKIKELDEALRLAKGEWMSYADAMKYANSIGSDGFMATDEQTKMATEALTRHREELTKTIQQKKADSQATSAERAELEQLDQALTKIKTGFTGADDVMARWAEHMNAGKQATEAMSQQTETLAQTLDEKLAGATSSWDAKIEEATSYLEDCNEELDKYEQELQELSDELKELEQKHSNRSWLWKKTYARQYQWEDERIEWLREETGSGNTFDEEGNIKRVTQKGLVDNMRNYKQSAQERLAKLKQLKAEELGLAESEVQAEEKKADAKRLTNEQMQQGIKLLEEEYAKTDHTTEEGIKKRQQLRETIDQMNQELKESTGEWMSVADAMKLAGQAEKNTFLGNDGTGFTASAQDIQKATQALERQRDVILQTIKAKRDSGKATDDEEKELQDLTNKLKALKFEQDNFNMSQAKMQELMRTPTNAVSLDELRSAIKRADGELKRMEGSLGQNNAQYKAFAEQVRNAKNQLKEMEGAAKASATAWEKAWNRLKTYVVMYMGFNAVWQKMMGTADDLMQLSDKMGEVRKTTGFTADEVGRLSDSLKKLDTRTTINGLLDLSVAAGQLGLKTQEDVQGFTEAANKLMVALPEMGKEGATEMLKVALATGEIDKIRKQMEQGLIDGSSATAVAMEKVGSTIDRLRATSAATAPAITDFVKRVGAVGAQSGISIDQVAALGSTVDALGMRVEMSATALSRMIPAIKNNAFAVAKAIGVTPETLRNLFETGRGMEAILMIFQHIKDANMDSDSIESMLGMGNMKEIMKELNQMGARAGIVFSGLSQNVDELRRQLNVAGDAYEQNIAIQQEYEKMNETTAAKWERLKNQIEEMFVGDESQSWLGHIIDGLRTIVDLLAGPLSGAFKGALAGLGSYSLGLGGLLEKVKDFATGEEDASEKIKEWWDKLKEGNVWDIVVSGTIAAGFALYDYLDSLKEAAREVARFNEELVNEQNKVEDLTKSITAANANVEEAEKDVAKAREEVEKAKKALDEAKKSTDDTKEATDKLAEAESKLIVEEEKKRNSMAEQKKLVEQFNSLYGKYLGFMISEISSTNELNKARDLLNTKLRETITLKRKEAALNRLEESEGEGRDAAYSELSLALGSAFRKQVVVGHDKNKKEIKAWTEDRERNAALLRQVTELAQSEKLTAKQVEEALAEAGLNIYETGRNGEKRINAYGANIRNLVMNYSKEYKSVQKKVDDVMVQFDVEASLDRKESQEKLSEQYKESASRYGELEKEYANATGKAKKQAAANLLKQADTLEEMITAAPNYYDLNNESEKASYEKFVKDTQARIDGIKDQREALIKEAGNAYQARKTVSGDMTTGGGGENPWGSRLPAESTAYADMNADVLVNRRKQMKDFVNAIQTDTDVQSVLKEDAALKKAIENGMSADMRTVIEWYNTERLKIQDELHARHLTNTGDWMDPKKQRARKKQLESEYRYYLQELDAYYTERKAEIQNAATEEGVSEQQKERQIIDNEVQWQQRRMELMRMYRDEREKVTDEEAQAIFKILAERTDDTEEMVDKEIKQTVKFANAIKAQGHNGEVEFKNYMAKLDLMIQQSLVKQKNVVAQQMKAIHDIIMQERPFDGIAENMRKNLGMMGILVREMEEANRKAAAAGEEVAFSAEDIALQELRRTSWLLGQAENAYKLSIDELLDDMAKQWDGEWKAWADSIRGDRELEKALLAMLHQTYDKVQDAIKKEASLIKKQVEISWNDMVPGLDKSAKQTYEAAISQLGLMGDQVSRANSLIGAGQASERVADKLAIKQMQVRLAMQEHYYNLIQQKGRERIKMLEHEVELAKEAGEAEKEKNLSLDLEHAKKALNLALSEEQVKKDEQRVAIANQLEESQNRLYRELKEWGDLLASSVQNLMEASHAGDAEYYNELAKLNLTGKGGPGAGTYIVIDNAGTEDAEAHYEYLSEREALERQHEIERENAQAEAWRKVMDDLNAKMNEQITDWINASLQNQSIDANTNAVLQNTEAIAGLTSSMQSKGVADFVNIATEASLIGTPEGTVVTTNPAEQAITPDQVTEWTDALSTEPWRVWEEAGVNAARNVQQAQKTANQQIQQSTQSTFAKMTAAANLYGVAYQTMSNDNLDASQKWEMFALQAAGQAAISMLTMDLAKGQAENTVRLPGILGKLLGEMPYPAAMATYAAVTALLGGLMGMAVSQVTKSKAQISQVTGASSASAGKLTTGMLQYGEGNVNEFTDPGTLTVGRQYNVDAADGHTYRARYMGKDAKTHLTNGPEFHLVGEKGQEAIIDAHTTRNIRMNDPEIWHSIQTLYNGGSLRHSTRRRGVRAFADGNMEDFEEMSAGGANGANGSNVDNEIIAGLQASLDRNSAVLERALEEGFKGIFDVYGKGGLVDSYDTGKKTVMRHGERY